MKQIGPGKAVTLHFTLSMEDGTEIDSTRNRPAANFVVGDGSLLKGVEESLFGLTKGDVRSIQLSPQEAFGMPNPGNIHRLPRKRFPDHMPLATGLLVSFNDIADAEIYGQVRSIEGETVVVDFNHPLAGQSLVFDVNILSVEDAP